MVYCDLNSSFEIKDIINTVKREFRNLANLTLPKAYEQTMGTKSVLTIYQNLQPSMKIEGDAELLDLFRESLEKEKENY